MQSLPVGSIIAWTDSMANLYHSKQRNESKSAGNTRVSLPEGWLLCDGTLIEEPSVWAGLRTPNINDEHRFLRGALHNEVLQTEEDAVKSHDHDYWDYYVYHYDWSCASDGAQEVMRWNINNDDGLPDPFCRKHRTSDNTGGTETRPKNTKVLYIMKVF